MSFSLVKIRQNYDGFKKKKTMQTDVSNRQDDENFKDRSFQCNFLNIATLQNSGFLSHAFSQRLFFF